MRRLANRLMLSLVTIVYVGCQGPNSPGQSATVTGGLSSDAARVAQERGLTPDDMYAAAVTYMPSGKLDPYVMFASGGHSGQVLAIGVPSMRILKLAR